MTFDFAAWKRNKRKDPIYRRKELDRDNASMRARRAADPEKYRAIDRDNYKKDPSRRARYSANKLYGLTLADKWTRLFSDQQGRCANPACEKTAHDKRARWHIHHIHDSEPMKWCVCCHRCNWAAGKFEDKPDLMRGMADLNENLTPDGYRRPSLMELVIEAQSF